MKFGWGNSKSGIEREGSEKKDGKDDEVKKQEGEKDQKEQKGPDLPPVSFFKMFKFSMPFDIVLDVIGIIAAAAAGVAQPILALLFGTLALNFIDFGTTVKLFRQGDATQTDLNAAASEFRRSANQNALYFVYAGERFLDLESKGR